jgi:hypothetical protein
MMVMVDGLVHRMMVVVVARRVMRRVMMVRGRGRPAGGQRQGGARRERQGDEFQGFSPNFRILESIFGHSAAEASRQLPRTAAAELGR